MKKIYVTFFSVLFICSNILAQDKITAKDASAISYEAKLKLQGLSILLNSIVDTTITPDETSYIETDSYSKPSKQIFLNKEVQIESDIDPQSNFGNSRDMPLDQYLNQLDTRYVKGHAKSIFLSAFSFSNIKENKDYVFLRVKFDEEFKGRLSTDKTPYPVRSREAIMRVTKGSGTNWVVLIGRLKFYNPSEPIESTANDLQVLTDTSASTSIVSQDEISRQRDSLFLAKDAEVKKIDTAFRQHVSLGNNYLAEKNYKGALDEYEKAQDLKPLEVSLDISILEAKQLVAENSYDNLKIKGDRAKSELRYKAAIEFYQLAALQKPELAMVMEGEMKPLKQHLSLITSPEGKLESGLYQTAIDECEKILGDHKKEKEGFPELYLVQALAYQKMYESKPADSRLKDKAIKNYDIANQYFANYLDARIARADFHIKYMGDYVGAISDYDMLTLDALDNSPEKPVYFFMKARWKEMVHNFNGALEDYAKAIELKPKIDSFYFQKGKLLLNLGRYGEAKINFDRAIKLNSAYKSAFYFRGLTLVFLNQNYLGGQDFIALEKLGALPAQIQTIDSLSNNFFVKGEALYKAHDFDKADSAYDNSLKIRSCNFSALHGKAGIRFTAAEELMSQSKLAAAKKFYSESIEVNRQSINCNRNFSDAWFIKGLGHSRIGDPDSAIRCFTEAIRSDNNNIQAYLERGNTYQALEKHLAASESYAQAITLLLAALETAQKNNKEMAGNIIITLSKTYQLNGRSQYYVKSYTDALASLKKAIDYDKTNAEAFYYRGLVNEELNESSKAINDYEDAIKQSRNYKYYYAIGKANFKAKNYEQAVDNFDNAILHDSLTILKNKYYLRGLSLFKLKKYDKALSDYIEYEKFEEAKKDTSFYADYGLAELYLGKDTLAVKHFNQALSIKPEYYRAYWGLSCAHAKAGAFDTAIENMKKALITYQIKKDDIKRDEDTFFDKLKDDKTSRSAYNELKKQYIIK